MDSVAVGVTCGYYSWIYDFVPILMTVRNSFFDIKILSGINEFCGIQNYLKIFSDPKVLTSIRFTVFL